MSATSDPVVGVVAGRVLAWYDVAGRELPWRRPDVTPWGVLVSEVMLQQTPVARVLPAYVEWLGRWPTPAALAAEPAGEAIRAWHRLGYPRRALRLHAAAQVIAVRHCGEVPSDLAELLALPGVGTYTARAVASFAFGQRHAVVDTNVRRVLARAVRGVGAAGSSSAAADLRFTETLLPEEPAVAARFAVAFMELGALVCTARAPACADCPLAPDCRWASTGRRQAPAARRRTAYGGSDRQARGELLRRLRASAWPVPAAELLAVWPDDAQGARALESLVADGLAVHCDDGTLALP